MTASVRGGLPGWLSTAIFRAAMSSWILGALVVAALGCARDDGEATANTSATAAPRRPLEVAVAVEPLDDDSDGEMRASRRITVTADDCEPLVLAVPDDTESERDYLPALLSAHSIDADHVLLDGTLPYGGGEMGCRAWLVGRVGARLIVLDTLRAEGSTWLPAWQVAPAADEATLELTPCSGDDCAHARVSLPTVAAERFTLDEAAFLRRHLGADGGRAVTIEGGRFRLAPEAE